MTVASLLALLLYVAHLLIVPLLLMGFIRTAKARIQNRQGPPVLQAFWDVLKLLRRTETVSETATWVFRTAPLVGLATSAAAGLLIPWVGVAAPFAGDLFLVVYLVALGKFAMGLAALDTGSPFGLLGASREAAISVQAEPALVMALAAFAARAHTSSFAGMLAPGQTGAPIHVLVPVALGALWIAVMAEMARMPVDDPTTHLELTMVHEALILENSGRNLALVEYSVAVKMAVLLGLLAQIALIPWPQLSPVTRYAASLVLIFGGGAIVAVSESVLVKLRWRRVPNLLSFSLAGAALACLVVAVKG